MNTTLLDYRVVYAVPLPVRQSPERVAIECYRQLARSVVLQAVRDGLKGSDAERAKAAEWLVSEYALALAEWAGFDTALIVRWVNAGCPKME